MRTIILTLICHYSGMNGKVVFLIPFLLDQEVILLRQSLLMDQVPVFLPIEPRLAPYGRPFLRGHVVIVYLAQDEGKGELGEDVLVLLTLDYSKVLRCTMDLFTRTELGAGGVVDGPQLFGRAGGWLQVIKAGESADDKTRVCHAVLEQRPGCSDPKAGCIHISKPRSGRAWHIRLPKPMTNASMFQAPSYVNPKP